MGGFQAAHSIAGNFRFGPSIFEGNYCGASIYYRGVVDW